MSLFWVTGRRAEHLSSAGSADSITSVLLRTEYYIMSPRTTGRLFLAPSSKGLRTDPVQAKETMAATYALADDVPHGNVGIGIGIAGMIAGIPTTK